MLIIISLVVILIVLTYSYQKLSEKIEQIKRDEHRQHVRSYHKAGKVVDEARMKSQQLIEAGEQKAALIINESESLTQTTKAELTKAAEEASQQHIAVFQHTLENIEQNITKLFQTIPPDVTKQSQEEFAKIREALTSENARLQEDLKKTVSGITRDLSTTNHELQTELEKRIKAHLFEVAREAILQTVSKTLTREEHEKLILEAFEEGV